ncbi:MAG: hypothetical protein U9N09_01615, partial [Euryarchaeota archaeon]|nr:hypothetical protein [Euryarchaeota archaeon]
MTAEIAIMNKEAIAIAADSAVTLREGKIFTSANKIFSLSKYHPVGVMIYGNANFMGIPWETMIKTYRGDLYTEKFDTLKEYADDFINFLSREKRLIPESEQEKYFEDNVYSYFSLIRYEIVQRVNETISERDVVTDGEINKITSEIIENNHDKWEGVESPPTIPENHTKDLINKYGNVINKAKKDVFENLLLTDHLSRRLTEIAVNLFVKFIEGVDPPNMSGVVIAGFGEKDIFPSLQSFLIEVI